MMKLKQQGFTLLELLLVLSLLAMLATLAVSSMEHTGEAVTDPIARAEMQAIRQALLQFKQDTGYLPNAGEYACANIIKPMNKTHVDAVLWQDWCAHPANFWMLFEKPDVKESTVEDWNKDTARGWRGPYLTQVGDGWLDLPLGYPDANASAVPVLPKVRAVADPLQLSSKTLLWHPSEAGDADRRWGRPYLFMDSHDATKARLVWTGRDGQYNPINPSDICAANNAPPVKGVDDVRADLVLCLY